MSNAELKKRLRLACLIILALGLCGALLIYLVADEVVDDSLGYVIVNGTVYPLATADSKKYRREIQRFGGKAALVFDDFSRWLGEQWQGKTLARTIALISLLLALGIHLFADSLRPDAPPDGADARGPDEPA
jgi:hypothetical protein